MRHKLTVHSQSADKQTASRSWTACQRLVRVDVIQRLPRLAKIRGMLGCGAIPSANTSLGQQHQGYRLCSQPRILLSARRQRRCVPHRQRRPPGCQAAAEPDRLRQEEAQRLFESLQRGQSQSNIGSQYGEVCTSCLKPRLRAMHGPARLLSTANHHVVLAARQTFSLNASPNACRASSPSRRRVERRSWTWTR